MSYEFQADLFASNAHTSAEDKRVPPTTLKQTLRSGRGEKIKINVGPQQQALMNETD
ncbi:hypothetical protein HLV39_02360 [Marinobacter adhaerens]|jgi:hypothetical protein|uniref:Uncharacterized protein n=1 Tax=Marinobacter adhaerens TaxID=1033846 RepID=A0A851HSS6_9GAMM|nr:hypothetical protein [Marinobacter adhaerens]NWN90342.1 hypothetical protein [Marinobacter adhaerens]